ncbi:winged helix-turn-helix domain-containing tetratricopeptide repeat protein [Halovulum sp. GXIMD14794]
MQIDTARGELSRDGVPVALEPQVLDLIVYLASNPGTVLTRDDLIAHVWAGRIVSDSAISSRINAARTALGDDGQAQRLIRTIPRRGYRFEGTVVDGPASIEAIATGKPSVAVLPFRNLSGEPEEAYFCDGITNDIIIGLARCRELFVIARQSSFAYRDGELPLPQIARELGVQYILEGGVRRAGDRIRVTAQLIDPESGAHLWADRFDRNIVDIFEVQDDITSTIVNTLTGEITRDRYRRSLAKSSDKVDAYDHFLRASEFNYVGGRDDVIAARDEALKAIAIDPLLARAHALIAWTYIADFLNAWGEGPDHAIAKARDYALAAVKADGQEPLGYAVLGWVYMCLKDFDRGLAEQRRAIGDNPGNAHYRSLYAFTLAYAGRSEEAIEELEKAMVLNPRYPDLYDAHYGRALFNLRRYEEAIRPLQKIRTSQPGNGNAIAVAAACYAALGRLDEAHAAVDEVRAANPKYTLEYARRYIPFAKKEDLEHFLTNLERAGL